MHGQIKGHKDIHMAGRQALGKQTGGDTQAQGKGYTGTARRQVQTDKQTDSILSVSHSAHHSLYALQAMLAQSKSQSQYF